MRIVVGLGNPSRQYVDTRHNIGFAVVQRLARKLGWISSDEDFTRLARQKFDGLVMDGIATLPDGGSEKLLIIEPMTYMNLSGQAVQAAVAFYQIAATDLMIVLDDLALPCGRLRLRKEGSSGGHNGLKDIERALGTSVYPRLRIGIDPPPPRVPQKDYVLGRFTDAQRQQLDPAVDRAAQALLTWMNKGIETTMNLYNAEEQKGTSAS